MYCLPCPKFQFDFICEYASPALKVELRKLPCDEQSETEKVKHIAAFLGHIRQCPSNLVEQTGVTATQVLVTSEHHGVSWNTPTAI
jgi:hypothetical protein